jgi:hypothetical protein
MNNSKKQNTNKSNKLKKITQFFKDRIKNNVLIFGKNISHRKTIIIFLTKYFCNIFYKKGYLKSKQFSYIYPNKIIGFDSDVEFIRVRLLNQKKQGVSFSNVLNSKLFNLSKFNIKKKIIVLFEICNLNKKGQKLLYKLVKKYSNLFFFIFTAKNIKFISLTFKSSCFSFPISEWKYILKKINIFSIESSFLKNSECNILKLNSVNSLKINLLYGILYDFNVLSLNFIHFYFKSNIDYNKLNNNSVETSINFCLENFMLKNMINFIAKQFLTCKIIFLSKWNKTKNLILKIFYTYIKFI